MPSLDSYVAPTDPISFSPYPSDFTGLAWNLGVSNLDITRGMVFPFLRHAAELVSPVVRVINCNL
eukprot:COSAG02_NODE_21_length_53083_cov_95.733618_3_plen_65_part_00